MTSTETAPTADAPLPPRADLPLAERIRVVRNFHTGSLALQHRYGPVCRVELAAGPLRQTLVFVSSPAGVRDVLAARDGTVDKTGRVHVQSRLLGHSSFTMAHDEWLPRRRTLQPVFTKQHVETYARHMAAVAEAAVGSWRRGDIDLDHEMRRLTLNVLGRSLFGKELGDAAAASLAAAMPEALTYITRRMTSPVAAPAALPTPARARFRGNLAVIREVIDEAVADYRRDPANSSAELVRLLHEASDPETGAALTAEQIRDELQVFLLAGHDTTATTLTFALWQLGRRPDLQDQVAAEVSALDHDVLQPADVHALPLTTRVLYESMRLCPPAAAVGRRVEKDLVVDGYLVPVGAELIVSMYALHRDPAAWDDPEAFDPDRFLPERSEHRDRWQFLPFGGGPRKCIGAHFAMLEATIGLATMVRTARFESLSERFDVALPFTMTAAGQVPTRVEPRSQEIRTRT